MLKELSLLLVLATAPLSAQNTESWSRMAPPAQIADSLFYIGSAGLSSFLFVSEAGHVLIDPTLEENVDGILANVRRLGFDPDDIAVILTTHAHWDHVAGAARLIEETGAELWVSSEDAPFIREGRDFGFESEGYSPATISREIIDGDVVAIGSIELTAVLTPGHTPGCTSWTGNVFVSGVERSFVLVCSLSPLSLYRFGGSDPTYEGQAADLCSSLARLRAMEVDMTLSNHPGFFEFAARASRARAGDREAFVDPAALGALLDEVEGRIDREFERQGVAMCGA